MTEYGMVIAGAGQAGAVAAVGLREHGWTGSITLIGNERWAPYELPPLSKKTLTGHNEPFSPTYVLDDLQLQNYRITYLANNPAVRIDRQRHQVWLHDGRSIGYERLLLATGASPRKLAMEGSDVRGAYYLRTFDDALALRSRLLPGQRIVVIGGGFIGLEVAASARENGCETTLIEAAPRLLMRGVPEAIAVIVEARHREAGVRFQIGTAIARIDKTGEEHTIVLANGTTITCDVLIVGIGAVPNAALAENCGLTIDNGICTDEKLTTSDPDILAAGDCCSFPHRLFGGRRIRLEAWRNALNQGEFAARNLLGASETYDALPWFWSDQYDLTLQVTGLPDAGTVTVERDAGSGNRLFFHLDNDGLLVAASGIGAAVAKEIKIAEMLIRQQAKPEQDQLRRPDVKLKSLLRQTD